MCCKCDNKTNARPKEFGSPIVNIKCMNCGAMFSERNGHTCGDDNF